jgi:hypothetical protein
MSRIDRVLRWKLTSLSATFVVLGCLVCKEAKACILPSSQTGVLFDHVPAGIDAPVVVEVTVVSREANVDMPNHARLAVLNARVDKVIKGTLDSDVLRIVTYLNSCSRIGVGHGFVAGMLRQDPQRGLELLAIQRPYVWLRPEALKQK